MQKNSGMSGENTGRNRQFRFSCVRGQKGLEFGLYKSERYVEWNGGAKKGVKNPKLLKICPAVSVQVSAVPVQVALCRFLHYRYRLQLYILFFYILYMSIFIFLQIGNSSADVKSILVDCLPSQVSLHAYLFLLLIFCPN